MNRVLLLSVAVAAAAAACGRKPGVNARDMAAPRAYRVSVEPVASRPLSYAVQAVGTLEAYDMVTVAARVAGTLERLDFHEGDAVTTDAVLAVIDGRRYELDLEQAKAAVVRNQAAVESARARTGQADAALREAESGLARRRGLREKNPGWVSEDELSTLETAVARARASVEEARAGEKVAQAQLEESRTKAALAEKDSADARVRSPLAGTIQRRHVSVGQYVREGDEIATLVDTSRLRLRFRVTESESVKMKPGQEVLFRVAAFEGRDLRASLFYVNATADPATRMVECLASVAAPEPGLRPGFFATVGIEIARASEAIVVPVSAVLPTDRGFTAFVVEDGRARPRVLRLGLYTQDDGVEVISGLRAGESLVVRGAQSLQEGVPVALMTPEGRPAAGPAAVPAPAPAPGPAAGKE